MDAIPPGLLEGVGVIGVVLLVAWMLFTGRLVTRREADDIRHDRDEWRTTARISESSRQVLSDQVAELIEHARVTESVLRALSQTTGGGT